MSRRELVLAVAGVLLLTIAVTTAILTAGMEPCWPDCRSAR